MNSDSVVGRRLGGKHDFRTEVTSGMRICVRCGRPKTKRSKMMICEDSRRTRRGNVVSASSASV